MVREFTAPEQISNRPGTESEGFSAQQLAFPANGRYDTEQLRGGHEWILRSQGIAASKQHASRVVYYSTVEQTALPEQQHNVSGRDLRQLLAATTASC